MNVRNVLCQCIWRLKAVLKTNANKWFHADFTWSVSQMIEFSFEDNQTHALNTHLDIKIVK